MRLIYTLIDFSNAFDMLFIHWFISTLDYLFQFLQVYEANGREQCIVFGPQAFFTNKEVKNLREIEI